MPPVLKETKVKSYQRLTYDWRNKKLHLNNAMQTADQLLYNLFRTDI